MPPLLVVLALALAVQLPGTSLAAQSAAAQSATAQPLALIERLRALAESALPPDRVLDVAAAADFYEARAEKPLWTGEEGPTDAARALAAVLAGAAAEGLDPARYDGPAALVELATAEPRLRAAGEIGLTLGLLAYARDLTHGRLTSEQQEVDFHVGDPPVAARALLDRLAASADPAAVLSELAPSNPYYRRLRRALGELRTELAAGGWPAVPEGPTLRQGDRGPGVLALRRRLLASGDLTLSGADPAFFDAGLTLALKSVQHRLGLKPDGILGRETRAQLNIPLSMRIEQVIANMERWRWLPGDLGERYVLVNLAAFELEVADSGSQALKMRVVVGEPYNKTPVFSGSISYLEINPFWNVPTSIAVKEMLPKIRRDPDYLRRERLRILAGWSPEAPEIDPARLDWDRLGPGNFPYRLRQDPGPDNALGRIKFMFPNRYNVYLHDTPARALFERRVRAFSHGCIRVERPLELAAFLLRDEPDWNAEAISKAIESGERQVVVLSRTLPVYITYATAWVGEGGTLNFRDDIYGRDGELLQNLATIRGLDHL